MTNPQFSKLNRNSDWKNIFDTIDSNFSKVSQYLTELGNRVIVESFYASANQTEFKLSGQYNTKRNCLAVYKNGVRQWLTDSFKETSVSSFSMMDPCDEGDQIVAVYNKYYIPNDPNPQDHIILQSPNGTNFKVTVSDSGTLVATEIQ